MVRHIRYTYVHTYVQDAYFIKTGFILANISASRFIAYHCLLFIHLVSHLYTQRPVANLTQKKIEFII